MTVQTPASGGYRPVADSLVMLGRSLKHTTRNIDSLLVGIILPVMMLLLMTSVFGGAMVGGRGEFTNYVVPGVILLCAGYGASMTAMRVTADMKKGIVARFRTMNVLPSAVLTGHVIASVLRNLLSVVLVVGTAMVIGFRPTGSVPELLGAFGVLTLFILALSWMSAAVGLVAKSEESAAVFGFALLFLPYMSSAFARIETLPGWLQPLAQHQPITPINEALRALLMGTPIQHYGWLAVAWCLGILLCSGMAAAMLWRRTRK